MNQHPFIFSNEKRYRLQRHVAFWLFWGVFQGVLYAFLPVPVPVGYLHRLPQTMLDSLMYLPCHAFLSYSLMYFVIPVYVVKNKYTASALWSALFILGAATTSALTSMYLIVPAHHFFLPAEFTFDPPTIFRDPKFFCMAVLAGLRGGITVGGVAAAIKLMKHWYVEGQRNLQLQKENIQSQLEVLKAQVHPHFLFNTLNNIYSHTQGSSPTASKLVVGLSDMLRYMLYECNHPVVSLEKEIKMLDEYIALEKIRYGNELEMHVQFPDAARDFSISPLLLLPFVENAFKHGVSNVLDYPWLNLSISLQGEVMTLKLLNSKPETAMPSQRQGIGIENVRKRLALLYPGKHELVIANEADVFIVNLKLELERRITVVPVTSFPQPAKQVAALA